MVLNRTQSIDALTHILTNVIGRGEKTPLREALTFNGITEILDLINLCQEDIDALTYPDPNNNDVLCNLNSGDKNIIRIFLEYVAYRACNKDAIGDKWTAITRNSFACYRNDNRVIVTPTPPPTAKVAPTAITTRTIVATPTAKLQQSIERDPTQFPVIKKECMKDIWHQKMSKQARLQGLSQVLDKNYTPSTPEEVKHFDGMKKFMYSVLVAKVQTDQGRTIVRSHKATCDAQAAYKELKEYHDSSTEVKVESSSVLYYIAPAEITDRPWQGTTESIDINWQDQVCKYKSQVDVAETSSDAQKCTMLQDDVRPVKELSQVRNNKDIEYTMTGNIFIFQQYVNLLLSAAVFHIIKLIIKHRRFINMHTVQEDESNKPDNMQFHIGMHHGNLLEAHTIQYQCPFNTGCRVFIPEEQEMQLFHTTRNSSWIEANTHVTYHVSQAPSCFNASVIDRGANGGIAGSDVRVVHQTSPNTRCINIQGIDNHHHLAPL